MEQPQDYPSFSPQDFPATRAAAHQAWKLAEEALKREPDSEVGFTNLSVRVSAHAAYWDGICCTLLQTPTMETLVSDLRAWSDIHGTPGVKKLFRQGQRR